VHVPKLPKYLDPQAKLIFDLKAEFHKLTRQNHNLRDTIITAPTWELHALSHVSVDAKKKEAREEKALIEMHNSILRANTTYVFKPRTGGRMYFPSKVTGRPIPLKPVCSPEETLRRIQTGSLDGASVFSAVVGDSMVETTPGEAEAEAGTPSLATRSQSGSGSRSRSRPQSQSGTRPGSVRKEVTGEVTLDVLLRKRGTTGPIVFKPKNSVGAEGSTATSLSPEQRVAPVRPLRETTRLGLGKEVVSVPLLDWPVEIRRRVASAKKDVLPEEPIVTPIAEIPSKDAGMSAT
jgi:hypothetical protein